MYHSTTTSLSNFITTLEASCSRMLMQDSGVREKTIPLWMHMIDHNTPCNIILIR